MSMARYRFVAEDLKRFLIGGKLLEVGCGTGRLLITLAEELPEISFKGADISEEMLCLARANAQKEGFSESISLLKGTAEELSEIPDSSFDCVLSHASFSGWLDPENSLKEISRILKPGGVLYISDWRRDAPMEAVSALMRRAMNEPAHLERIRMAFEAAYSEGEFKGILSHSPFALIEFRTEDHWMTGVLRKG